MTVRTIGETAPTLSRKIRESVHSGLVSLPPMPPVAARVLKLLQDDYEGPVGKLVELIGSDPALAAAILRAANSAVFGGLQSVSEIKIALARLGARQTTTIVAMASHKANFISNDPARQDFLKSLWDHSIVTAQGARRLAGLSVVDTNDAFIAGLLHDTGKLLLLRAFDQIEARPPARPLSKALRDELMLTLHAELGAHVLKQWRLPTAVWQVALHHHDADPPESGRLLACVQAANAVARKLGAHPEPNPDLALAEVPAIGRLPLGDPELAELMVNLEADLSHLRGLL